MRKSSKRFSIFKKILVQITFHFLFFAKIIQISAHVVSFFIFYSTCLSYYLSFKLSSGQAICLLCFLSSALSLWRAIVCLMPFAVLPVSFASCFHIFILLCSWPQDYLSPAGPSICLLCYRNLLWYCYWAWLSVGSVCLEYSLYTVFSAPRFVWYTSTALSSLSKLKIKK